MKSKQYKSFHHEWQINYNWKEKTDLTKSSYNLRKRTSHEFHPLTLKRDHDGISKVSHNAMTIYIVVSVINPKSS